MLSEDETTESASSALVCGGDFRKRRLSLPSSLHLHDKHHSTTVTSHNTAALCHYDDDNELSRSNSVEEEETAAAKVVVKGALADNNKTTKTPHAKEHCEPPNNNKRQKLFYHKKLVYVANEIGHELSQEDIDKLPFPSDVVGIFSCSGIEPVYLEEDDDEDENNNNNNCGGVHLEIPESERARGALDAEYDTSACVAKINQDRGGVAYPYANDRYSALFAAYDGHGDDGDLVAQYVVHEVHTRLEGHPSFLSNISEAFKDVFVSVDQDLRDQQDIDATFSGTTAVAVLRRSDDLYISNVGDSRAVLARKQKTTYTTNTAAAAAADDEIIHKMTAIDLSVDQNPDSPGEIERIKKAGGFVSPPAEEGLSARVWLDRDFTQIGLAMARSIGDHAVKPIGVIAEPVVSHHQVLEDDEFMILATDGVWEFISSQEAVDIVQESFDKGKCSSEACKHLIRQAAKKWRDNEGDYRDDITAVIVKLKHLWNVKEEDGTEKGVILHKQ